MEQSLVEGRACGSCNVCCIALTIDDPELSKAAGDRCRNALPDNGCSIYASRPQTCRNYHCGWRQLRWVRDTMRPDRSDVLVMLLRKPDEQGALVHRVLFTMLTPAGLDADGLAESVAAAVAAAVPSFLVVLGPPGFTAARIQLNDMLADAVRVRDKPGVLGLLREAHATCASARFKRAAPSDAGKMGEERSA